VRKCSIFTCTFVLGNMILIVIVLIFLSLLFYAFNCCKFCDCSVTKSVFKVEFQVKSFKQSF
jgi:hypothetical protein